MVRFGLCIVGFHWAYWNMTESLISSIKKFLFIGFERVFHHCEEYLWFCLWCSEQTHDFNDQQLLLLSFCFLDFSFVIFTSVFGVRKMISGFARQFLRMDTNGPSDQVGKTTSPGQILWLFEKLSSKALMLSLLFRCWNSQKMVKVWPEYWAMCY